MAATDGLHKPWLMVQLRLKKLQEERPHLSQAEYVERLADIQRDAQALGEWWRGREAEVFGSQVEP
ncbi:MAG: hypothetical protein AAGF24_15520 [Cyanobacteria bacterium P01_H01_bin.121]